MGEPGMIVLAILGIIAGAVVAVFAVIFLLVPLFKGIGWLIRHIVRFIGGMISDALRLVGAILLAVLYIPLILGSIVIGRWSASAHYGRALGSEVVNALGSLYRLVIGHLLKLLCLGRLTEGFERRLPDVIANAPTSDKPSARTGLFEGYTIVGSLPAGGSGAKLYVAEPDPVKRAELERRGLAGVDQVVIKSFATAEGSSLPQIVRESRSLDAAKRLGLILDHDLTPERFYYVMRYVPGQSLSLVSRGLHARSAPGGLEGEPLRSGLQYVADLLSTLDTYHRAGLWHKDVKPDNIIVTDGPGGGRAHLVDFGLVTSLGSAMTLTTHGTEYFRDPEMVRLALRGAKVNDVDGTRFDVYGAGAVLYSVIEDSFPAHGVLSEVTKRAPESVKWIIRRAMSDYDKRYASASQMLGDVRYVLASSDPFGVRPVDLPSLAEVPPIPGSVPGPAPVGTPGVGAAGAVAGQGAGVQGVRGRTAPVIEVMNWWSGRARLKGVRTPAPAPAQGPMPQTPAEWGRYAGDVANRSVDAAGEAFRSFRDTVRRGSPVPGVEVRAKIAAARARAQAKAAERRATRRSGFNNFVNFGVGVALLTFLGLMIGGGLRFGMRGQSPAPVAAVLEQAAGEARAMLRNGERALGAAGAGIRQSGAHVAAPGVGGRVLLVVDVMQPWPGAVVSGVERLESSLGAHGMTVIGPHLVSVDQQTPEDEATLDLAAGARLAVGQAPIESPEAARGLAGFLQDHRGGADLVVWVAPGIEKSSGARVLVFAPSAESSSAEDDARLAAANQAALTFTGTPTGPGVR